jgi:hypothetical protein
MLSIIAAVMLYQSFGFTVLEKGIYGGFGFVFAVAGVTLLVASGLQGNSGNYFSSFVCFGLWIIAVCFAVIAELGFMSLSQQHVAMNSESTLAARKEADDLATQLQSKSALLAVPIEQLQSKLSTKENEIANLQSQLNQCPSAYITACIRPITGKLARVRQQIAEIKQQIAERNSVSGLQSLKLDAEKRATGNDTQSLVNLPIHPLFVHLGRITGREPHHIQSWLLFLSACFFELLSGVFLTLGNSLRDHSVIGEVTTSPLICDDTQSTKKTLPQVNVDNVSSPLICEETTPRKGFGNAECSNCGESFIKKVNHQKFCSKTCNKDYWLKNLRAKPS